jgi:hypothetical protein
VDSGVGTVRHCAHPPCVLLFIRSTTARCRISAENMKQNWGKPCQFVTFQSHSYGTKSAKHVDRKHMQHPVTSTTSRSTASTSPMTCGMKSLLALQWSDPSKYRTLQSPSHSGWSIPVHCSLINGISGNEETFTAPPRGMVLKNRLYAVTRLAG